MDFVNSKIFPYLVAAAAGAVAISAAFFSVFGLSKLFAGAQTSVVIMAGSLEFAKLVTASFLYRYWKTVPTFLKNYLLVGTLILILITSAGIFGYLSNAYQGATTEFEKQSTVLMFKEDRLEQLNEDKIFLKQELEDAIAELPDNYRTARKKLREEYQPKIDEINQATLNVKQEIGDLSRITSWVRVFGMVNSAPGYDEQHIVINGFSELILEVFGSEIGRHSRSAIGVAGLPMNLAIEIEGEVLIK